MAFNKKVVNLRPYSRFSYKIWEYGNNINGIMYKRIFDIENKLDEGMFLFGARQTGKSTLLKERFKEAIYYDLLIPNVRKAFKRNPESFREALLDKPAGTLVIVDEIQKVPELWFIRHFE